MAYKDFGVIIKPDEKLSAIVGSEPLKTTQLVKKIWDYIKANNLKVKA